MHAREFKDMSIEEAMKALSCSSEGLTNAEAQKRLETYGINEIPTKKKSMLLLFISKFYGPIPIMLWLVIAISYVLGHIVDFYVVLALLIFNAIVSFAEEYKADSSIELLKKRLVVKARVLRSGSWLEIDAKYVVPGDIMRVRLGDIVAADAKVIEAEALEVDESALTGESMPVAKSKSSMIYAGSSITHGEATCVVVATGVNTYYGKTVKLVEEARPKSHLEEAIMSIVKYLVAADIGIVTIMFIYGVLVLHSAIAILLPFSLVVILASVPVALPAAFTVAMALGTEKLASKHVLITKLEALEETSNMNVLCLDKTGTVTENKIFVEHASPFIGDEKQLIKLAAEASRAEDKDPIDIAILDKAKSLAISLGLQLKFMPFDPNTKRTEAEIKDGKTEYLVAKGAPQVIAQLCKLNAQKLKEVEKVVDGYSSSGFRSIAVAKASKGRWQFAGIIALSDRLKPDAPKFIREIISLGIIPKMLTGDNIAVAKQIASELGLGKEVIDASSFDKLSESEMPKVASAADVFAGIYPSDKYKIVKALQQRGYIVGMTGDGINDAPAIKQAEVGIAVENATDVAKSTADLVLTKNGIDIIVEAIKESRRIFERMLTYTMVKIARVIQIVGFIAIIYLAFGFLPILSLQLILLIFTNDLINISIATDNVGYSKRPVEWNVKSITYASAVFGLLLVLQALALSYINTSILHLSIAEFQTAIFLMFVITDKLVLFNIRTRNAPTWRVRPSNVLILAASSGIAAGLLLSYYGILMTSINAYTVLTVVALALAFFLITEYIKPTIFKKFSIS